MADESFTVAAASPRIAPADAENNASPPPWRMHIAAAQGS